TRFVRLVAVSEVNGSPWASVAELNMLDPNGQPIARTAWTVTADSEELAGENGAAHNAIDGNNASFWHTQWSTGSPPHPHWLRIDLGADQNVLGLRYLPRQDGNVNGTIAEYEVY